MAILGELEERIMENLWVQGKPVSVRQVHENLLKDRELAYTTVMTVLDRLAKKKIVRRERDGRAWLYVAGTSRAELVATSLSSVLAQAGPDEAEVLHVFALTLTEEQRRQLRRALS